MILHADEPGVLRKLENLRQLAVWRQAGEQPAGLFQRLDVTGIHLIAVTVAFGDIERAIDFGDLAARRQAGRIRAEAHRAALVGIGVALDLFVALGPLFHQADQRCRRVRVILGRVRFLDTGHVAGRLDHRHLHAIANTEARHVALAGKPCRAHLAMCAALAKAARQDDSMHAFQNVQRPMLIIEFFGIDQADIDLHLVGKAAMRQRLGNGFVGVRHIGVFSDEADTDIAVRMMRRVRNLAPAGQVRLRSVFDAEMRQDFLVESLGMISARHIIDMAHIARFDHAGEAHITEAGNLALLGLRNRPITPAE